MECGCFVRLPDENLKKQESNSERQKRTSYKSSSHAVRVFEVLNALRKDEVLCDIKLETEDGTIVYGHKVVLASATPYFQAMFTSFEESKKSHVILQELDSTSVKLLVEFIYTGQIMVTEDNVQVLLQAANLLQLHDVKQMCCDFTQTLLNPKNCFSLKARVSLYDCDEYLSSFKSYILQNFSKIENDAFLNLPFDELVEIISGNELNDSSEEKVFECVVKWVNHDLSNRKDVFPKLMEHVRLPLASKEYLHNRVREEPLLKNCLKCRDYLDEALYFHLLKSEKPNIIRTKPRQPDQDNLQKVILFVGKILFCNWIDVQWFDPLTMRWQLCPEISVPKILGKPAVVNDQLLFFISDCQVHMLDLFSQSPCYEESVPMLKKRSCPGVGVLDICIYVIGGVHMFLLRSAEVFNLSTQKWQMISDMSTARQKCSVGVLNNHLYAVGGSGDDGCLKSVERYCPKTDTWTPVADMNERRSGPGVGVLNGVLYAVGGFNGYVYLSSVEAYNPNSNTWTLVNEMHKVREYAGVAALNGLLYVINQKGESDQSVEMYNPKSNIWTMLPEMKNAHSYLFDPVVINKPPYFKS